jgi:hypothetical protein
MTLASLLIVTAKTGEPCDSSVTRLTLLSDFFLMEDCPTIGFDGIEVSASRLRAIVWRRSLIASQFNLTESQLIEAALLLGNDFTSPIPLSEYNEVPTMSQAREQAMDFVRSQPVGFQLSSRNPKVQLILDFSRDFYHLGDLSRYPFDDEEDVTVEAEPPLMTRERFIDSYVGQLNPSDRENLLAHLHRCETNDLHHIISTSLGNADQRAVDDDGSQERAEDSMWTSPPSVVSSKYLTSLQGMVESTRCGQTLPNQDHLESRSVKLPKKPSKKKLAASIDLGHSWEDIVVLDQFERLLKLSLRSLLEGLATESAWGSMTIRYDRINERSLATIFENQVCLVDLLLWYCLSLTHSDSAFEINLQKTFSDKAFDQTNEPP